MEDYWKSYFEGNLEKWASYLPDHYHNIGTTQEEIWNSKQDIVSYTHKILDQMIGMADFKNKTVQIIPYDPYIMVHELGDLHVKTEKGWVFYAHFRLSSLLEKTADSWKILHQHGSFPDHKAAEGEAFGFEAVKAENERLKKAVEERTTELENKNKELLVESALERVRTVAMSMKKPDDMLAVCRVISDELTQFGIDGIRNVQTVIIQEEQKIYLCYQYFPAYNHEIIERTEYLKNPVENELVDKISKAKDGYFEGSLNGKVLDEFRQHRKEENHLEDPLMDKVDEVHYFFYSIGQGALGITLYQALNSEGLSIFKRFHQVFSFSYSRFKDLEKAVAQVRESEIELALERVRAKSLAMQKSAELAEVIQVVYQQFIALGVPVAHTGFMIDYRTNTDMHIWLADKQKVPTQLRIPYFDSPHWNSFLDAKEKGKSFFTNLLDFETKNKFYEDLFALFPEISPDVKAIYLQCKALAISTVLLDSVGLYIENFDGIPYSEEENQILLRVGKVFQQAYTRFLDLQKAEAQAREGEIELGLERVRARAMAMQHSDELKDLIRTVYAELTKLNLSLDRCLIWIMNRKDLSTKLWLAGAEGIPVSFYVPYHKNPPYLAFIKGWEERTAKWEYDLKGQLKKDWDQYVFSHTDMKHLPDPVKKAMQASPRTIMAGSFQSFGCLQTAGPKPLTDEQYEVLNRFAKVFDSTYTRFNDLQRAEAQAREAQVEAALERVRSRSMAMHKSEELADLSLELVKQVQALGMDTWFCAFNIYDGDEKGSLEWGSNGQGVFPKYRTPREGIFLRYYKAGQKGESLLINEIGKDECPAHYKYLCTLPGVGEQLLKMKAEGIPFPTSQIDHVAYFKYGYIIFITYEPAPESHEVFKRFAKVFEQTYTRFLDLQKAEAQAREAQIEAALERVRSRSMAMHNSIEIGEVALVLFQQLKSLGGELWGTGFSFCGDNSNVDEFWFANEKGIMPHLKIPNNVDPAHKEMYKGWKDKLEILSLDKGGKELKDHYEYMLTVPDVQPIFQDMLDQGIAFPTWQKWHAAYFKYGYMLVITTEPYENEKVFKRFAKVFEQAYTRFLDLQKAEAQAKEAQVELSLERIRSQVTAMRESSDLQDIVVSMRKEFVALGHEAHYFWYMRWMSDHYEKAMTSGDGTRIGMVMTLPRHIHGDIPLVADWEKSESPALIFPMGIEVAVDYVDKMISLGDFEQLDPQAPTLDDIRHIGGLTFVMARTTHGEIGFSLPGEVSNPSKESVDTLVRFAGVFDLAYKRFEDLKKAEKDLIEIKEAKQKAEKALSELKSAQAQLIQSEKMASLGELTAGIAHEIQNPLNFVNNFSEVSGELIDEAQEEIEKGDLEEIKFILQDLKDNLSKINHHGKRAGSIVKGMLEHSRKSEGKKELVDLNVLADECLKLGFHGLRAKDKTFSADFKTHFAEDLPEVSVVRQDIGRVLLNLINNAFYAVHDFGKTQDKEYKPTVTVSTTQAKNQIEITVSDNGKGIPEQIQDKIFQPFFTTKPTGEGTGLGLSLSYDIIKAHGGELVVKSKVGEGAIFSITLPIS
jgi:signal transduction histidine kinase